MQKNRKNRTTRERELDALLVSTSNEVREMIERLLAKPMHERTHFLRRRLPGGGSAL